MSKIKLKNNNYNNKNKKQNKKRRILSLLLVIILSFSLLLPLTQVIAHAENDNSNTNSIVADFFNPVFNIELSEGNTILDTDEDLQEKVDLNNSIYNKTSTKTYSLFDRFGSTIKYVPYFGEKRIKTGLLDRFYSSYLKNDYKFELNADTIKTLLTNNSAISNNNVYEGRADVLTDDTIEGGAIDPRVTEFERTDNGGNAAIGNLFLSISNFFTVFIAWLSGSGLYKTLNDLWITIVSNETVSSILHWFSNFFLPVAIIGFVILLVRNTFKAIKGQYSGIKLITTSLSVFISIALVYSFTAKPQAFSQLFTNVVTIFDNVLDKGLSIQGNEIVKSDITKNVRTASLWKTTVFEPWCIGTFGDKYENLYTKYDDSHPNNQMNQSNDDIDNVWSDGSIRYNSSKITGDINVPLGNNVQVKNWAALAWSCQSIFHIDAVQDNQTEENAAEDEVLNNQAGIDENSSSVWPRATTTPMNKDIFVDNFRWLDAKLNISPQYSSPEDIVMDYQDSNHYRQYCIKGGLLSLFYTLLLLPIGYLVVRKLRYAIRVITSGIILMITSMGSIVMPEKYNILENLKRIGKYIYELCWWTLIIFLAITLYDKLVAKNFLLDVIWILVGIILCRFRPPKTPGQVKNFARNVKMRAKSTGNKVINTLESKIKRKI